MNLKEIQALIKFVVKSRVSEVDLKTDTIQIRIKVKPDVNVNQESLVQQHQMPVEQIPDQSIIQPTVEETKESIPNEVEGTSKYVHIKSPMIGTFYRRSGTSNPEFVKVSDEINIGQVVCVIEAMKLFNEIESEISGKIIKVLVEDASPVEYEQPLFLVDPS